MLIVSVTDLKSSANLFFYIKKMGVKLKYIKMWMIKMLIAPVTFESANLFYITLNIMGINGTPANL